MGVENFSARNSNAHVALFVVHSSEVLTTSIHYQKRYTDKFSLLI